ncbi:pilus assembly protein [Chitinimonas arctica]|uniref:Pilus assembly protein n=1 Tax=Chitinimonas arctica TaxID=2594795 RepID=A0A516SLJ3_9NEIS|nr:pilus assembly protein [Chitinimonas arctica]QDQ29037.1 pilus assembly protein [Chitinimonas arctica]
MKKIDTLRQAMRQLPRRQSGQGMTEYIIIVALIAVAAIGVYSFFGQTIRNQVSGLASEVSGDTSGAAAARSAATASASSARSQGTKAKGMGSYGN